MWRWKDYIALDLWRFKSLADLFDDSEMCPDGTLLMKHAEKQNCLSHGQTLKRKQGRSQDSLQDRILYGLRIFHEALIPRSLILEQASST